MKLASKVAIVTGGGTGIGLGISRTLALHGASVTVAQIQPPSDAVDEGGFAYAQVDVGNRSEVDRMVSEVLHRWGRIDILVNNAAITGKAAIASFLECPETLLRRMLNVNVEGVFHCSQAVVRHMTRAGVRGSIIHISSVGAFAAQEHASVYCATKAAVVSLAQSMALELAPYGIRVNAIAPGDILTETSSDVRTDLQDSGASGRYMRVTPAGRRGSPDDVGQAVAWLASDEAAFVTGTTVTVDGGWTCY